MPFVKREQVLESLRAIAPDEAPEPRLAEALKAAGLKDKPHFFPEEVARLGRAMMAVAQGHLRDVPQR
jgi:hypothetical protein